MKDQIKRCTRSGRLMFDSEEQAALFANNVNKANPRKAQPFNVYLCEDSRKIVFQMAEVAVPRDLFQTILERIGRLKLATAMSG